MSVTAVPYLSPELEELLAEIAADPNSSLLRVQRPPRVRELLYPESPVRESCSMLTRAERKLLQVYREEAAWLLRCSAQHVLLAIPEMKALFNARTRADPASAVPMQPRHVVARKLLHISRLLRSPRQAQQVAMSAHRSAAGLGKADQLAALSMRLAPRDGTRVLQAWSLIEQDKASDADRLLIELVHSPLMADTRLSALTWLGVAACSRGDPQRAMDWYQRACMDTDYCPPPNASLSWLLTALVSQCSAGARSAARFAASSCRLPDEEVDAWLTSRSQELKAGRWTPGSRTPVLARAIADEVGGVGAMVAELLAGAD